MTVQPLTARNDGVALAGSLWVPDRKPRALLCMFPGSGPSDRDNDVLFPPIREALLAAGIAVCSYDKRGVGGSSGSWMNADIREQAGDLVAGLDVARAVLGGIPTGLFGHSQGGWVALDAAGPASADFVITNSGPGVTPREQETFSTRHALQRAGWDGDAVRAGVATFTAVIELLSRPFEDAWPHVQTLPLLDELIDAGVFIPADPALWSFAGQIIDHDPRPALEGLDVPLLALFGADDSVVPVRRSAEVYRSAVRGGLLDLRVLPGGDHRLQGGDEFVPGYLAALTEFVAARIGD